MPRSINLVWILLSSRRVRINTLIAATLSASAGLKYLTYDTIDPENYASSDIQYVGGGVCLGNFINKVFVTNVS